MLQKISITHQIPPFHASPQQPAYTRTEAPSPRKVGGHRQPLPKSVDSVGRCAGVVQATLDGSTEESLRDWRRESVPGEEEEGAMLAARVTADPK